VRGPEEVKVKVEDESGTIVVCPEGELDLAVADAFRTVLQDALRTAHRAVQIDLAAVTFIDSTALAVLVDAWRQAEERGVTLCVLHPAPNVRRVLDITGLDRLLYPS
jgi:anti-sigma B factor antagonist